MKNLEIFELCVEVNQGWRSPLIKIEKADQNDMFEVAPADLYNVYVFTNNNELTVKDSDALLAADGISVTGLEFAGEDDVIAEQNGYSRCFCYVGDGSQKGFLVTEDETCFNDIDLDGFKEDEKGRKMEMTKNTHIKIIELIAERGVVHAEEIERLAVSGEDQRSLDYHRGAERFALDLISELSKTEESKE